MDRAQHLLTKELDGDMLDYYAILGVEKDDTDEIIKKRYKVLALKYHPDKFNGTDEEKEEGEKIMREVNLAWGTFKDKEKRKEYDGKRKFMQHMDKVFKTGNESDQNSEDEGDQEQFHHQGPPPHFGGPGGGW